MELGPLGITVNTVSLGAVQTGWIYPRDGGGDVRRVPPPARGPAGGRRRRNRLLRFRAGALGDGPDALRRRRARDAEHATGSRGLSGHTQESGVLHLCRRRLAYQTARSSAVWSSQSSCSGCQADRAYPKSARFSISGLSKRPVPQYSQCRTSTWPAVTIKRERRAFHARDLYQGVLEALRYATKYSGADIVPPAARSGDPSSLRAAGRSLKRLAETWPSEDLLPRTHRKRGWGIAPPSLEVYSFLWFTGRCRPCR